MLITITRTLEANVHKAVVETEANALDQAYMKAYGEPKVSQGGSLTYPDATRTAQNVDTGDAIAGVTADVPNSRTIVRFRAGAVDFSQIKVGDSLTFSDVDHEPLLNGTHLVMAVDGIHNSVAINTSGITTQDPFEMPVTIGTVVIGAQVEGQSLAGFTDDGLADLVLQLRDDTIIDLSIVTPGVDSITMTGVSLETGLNGTFPITAVSDLDHTITIATQGLDSQPVFQVPVNEGDVLHTLSPVAFTVPSSEVFIRSSSPFELKISANTDAAAGSKVKSWSEDLRNKISAATLTLKAKPNPNSNYPIIESTEVV